MRFVYEISLILLFSIVELLGGKDEGGDVLPVVLLRHLHAPLGLAPLLLGVVEDGGHVLAGADRGRVVVVPEDVEQLVVAGDLGVPLELHGLGVVAEAPVGGALLGAAREPNTGPHDPRGTSKLCLKSKIVKIHLYNFSFVFQLTSGNQNQDIPKDAFSNLLEFMI